MPGAQYLRTGESRWTCDSPRSGENTPCWLATVARSEEHGEILGEQDVLVENDLAPGDLPASVDPAQHVLALADQEVRLRLHAVAIHEEAALHDHLARGRVGRRHLDVRDHVA